MGFSVSNNGWGVNRGSVICRKPKIYSLFITFARFCSFVRCKVYVNFHTNSLFPIQIYIILHLGNLWFSLLLLFPSRITWDQALLSFRFVNNILAGKAKRKENLILGPILAGLPKRECMTAAKIGPDLRLLRGPKSLSSVPDTVTQRKIVTKRENKWENSSSLGAPGEIRAPFD